MCPLILIKSLKFLISAAYSLSSIIENRTSWPPIAASSNIRLTNSDRVAKSRFEASEKMAFSAILKIFKDLENV